MVDSPLSPNEACKLIKFYLNLYPDLVGTLKEYFPKPVIRTQTTFNRTIRVKLPIEIKSEISVRLVKELSYASWWWEGTLLYIPYKSEEEFQRYTGIVAKIAKEFRIKGLDFRGLKQSPKRLKEQHQKPTK